VVVCVVLEGSEGSRVLVAVFMLTLFVIMAVVLGAVAGAVHSWS